MTAETHDTNPVLIAQDIFGHLQDAWNAADGSAFGRPFGPEADFIDIRGEHHRAAGPEAIGTGHQAIFDSIYAGSTISYSVDAARPLGPDHLLVHATSTLEAPVGPLAGTNHSRISAVLARNGESWQISALHNTLVGN